VHGVYVVCDDSSHFGIHRNVIFASAAEARTRPRPPELQVRACHRSGHCGRGGFPSKKGREVSKGMGCVSCDGVTPLRGALSRARSYAP
jgi:hypothetical protein